MHPSDSKTIPWPALDKMLLKCLVVLLLLNPAEVAAQYIYIRGVVVIHTKANSGYYQICFNPRCNKEFQRDVDNKRMRKKQAKKMKKTRKAKEREAKNMPEKKLSREKKTTQIVQIIDSSSTSEEPAVNKNIIEYPIDQVRAFKWVYFDTDQWELSDSGKLELVSMVKYLSAQPNLKITIYAHTDNQGTDDYNLKLSEQRARAVVEYLIVLGLEEHRIKWEALGAAVPIASNTSEANQALNRRVEYLLH